MVKNPSANAGDARDVGLIPGLGRKWQPTPVFLPGEFHGQRSLVSYSPWDGKELDSTEHVCQHHSTISDHQSHICILVQFSSVQSLSRVLLSTTPWTAACQASLSIINSQSPPKPMSIKSVMPSNHLILCHPLLLLPSIFPSIRVFSNESAIRIR